MAFAPIAFIAANYRDYKTEWLKAYEPGTTTPKAMSLDSAGATQVAKLQLNADGFIVSAGGALVIPYIEDNYDLWLFPTDTEADANDTSNAIRLADDINGLNLSIVNDLSQAYIFDTVALFKASLIEFPDGKTIHLNDRNADFLKITGQSGDDTNIIPSTNVSQSVSLPLSKTNIYTPVNFGALGDGSTVNDAALNSMFLNLPVGTSINTGSDSDIYLFNDITMPLGFNFIGSGTFKGVALGVKPTVAAMRATDSAGRLALLQTYTPSTFNVTGSDSQYTKGVLNISQALIVGTANRLQTLRELNLETCAYHGIGLSTSKSLGQISCESIIGSDSPVDGLFCRRGGQIYAPFGIILYSGERGCHAQLSGYIEIQDGEVHNSVKENIFGSQGSTLVGKRSVISNGGTIGLLMIYGCSGDFAESTVDDNGSAGVVCESNSAVLIEDSFIRGNGLVSGQGDGVNTSFSGFVQCKRCVITGNGRYALNNLTGGIIDASGSTIDQSNNSGGTQINSSNNGTITIDEPGTENVTALLRTDCIPTWGTVGRGLSFIGAEGDYKNEDTGISFSRRQYGERNIETIAAGVITATAGWLKIALESGVTDDLDTITYSDQYPVDEIVIQPNAASQTVVIKHNTGNLRTFDGLDITLDAQNKTATALWSKETSAWLVKSQ